jgi:hypothetical protein
MNATAAFYGGVPEIAKAARLTGLIGGRDNVGIQPGPAPSCGLVIIEILF